MQFSVYNVNIVRLGSIPGVQNNIKFEAVSDSGANIGVTYMGIVEKLGLKLQRWSTPILIKFGNSAVEKSLFYVYCGSIVGNLAVIESATETLLSLWEITQRGITVELDASKIIFKVTASDQLIYQQKSDQRNRQWTVDLIQLMGVNIASEGDFANKSHQNVISSQAYRGTRLARIPAKTVNTIRSKHCCLFHTASTNDFVEGLKCNAWLNMDEFDPEDVRVVLGKYPCIICHLAKLNRLATPVGSGVKPNNFALEWSCDFVLIKRPVSSSGGYIGWYHFVESMTGFKVPVFAKQDNSTAFLEANKSIQLLCKKVSPSLWTLSSRRN